MKTCSACNLQKPITDFQRKRTGKDGLQSKCKVCRSIEMKERYEANRSERLEKMKSWYWSTKEDRKDHKRQYRQENKDLLNALVAKRRALKKQASPEWSSNEWQSFAIKEVYSASRLRSEMTGIEHHVDHIVPLGGTNVCGLHVVENLRVITAYENIQKGNTWVS